MDVKDILDVKFAEVKILISVNKLFDVLEEYSKRLLDVSLIFVNNVLEVYKILDEVSSLISVNKLFDVKDILYDVNKLTSSTILEE